MTDLPLSRREMLGGTAALTATASIPSLAWAAPAAPPVERLLSGMAEQLLAEYPENATSLGLDTGARRPLKSRLYDHSLAGIASLKASAASRLRRLEAVNAETLPPSVRNDFAVTRYAHRVAVEGWRFSYGEMALLNTNVSYRNSPYVVTQNMGAWYEVPDFLDSYHKVENRADAEVYLARLQSFARQLDGETERMRHDRGLGVRMPTFIAAGAARGVGALRRNPAPLVASLVKRTGKIPGEWQARAETIVRSAVVPALDRQLTELAIQSRQARSSSGAWALPQGEAYYAWALKASTTTQQSPDEVHRLGLDLVARLNGEMDAILRKAGYTSGSVGERMTALGKDPRYLYPNTDAGRAQLLDYVNGRVADMRARLPRAFRTLVPGRLVVKRVPPEIEAGAPGGYAAAGTMDGSVPGFYYINLRDTADNPKWSLPTLTYHEGIPGHVWQGEYSYKLPLIRTLLAFNAYSEGWALYAEQLADELGAYDEDPLGRLGYLQSVAFRACRLVLDTGLHAKRWSRDEAIRWFVEANGQPQGSATSEVERYCSWPGQACGYEIGHQAIVRLRTKAQATLGSKYDLRDYDDAVVLGGNVPMDVLATNIDDYIRSKGGAI